MVPNGELYAPYWWAIPWLIAVTGLSSLHGFYTIAETATNRFGFLKWTIPLELAYPMLLLVVTEHQHLAGIIPASWTELLTAHNIYSLNTMLWWMTAITVLKALASLVAIAATKHSAPFPWQPTSNNT